MFISDEQELNNPALFYGVAALLIYSHQNNLKKPNTPSVSNKVFPEYITSLIIVIKIVHTFFRGKHKANVRNVSKNHIKKEMGGGEEVKVTINSGYDRFTSEGTAQVSIGLRAG
jgi:hypothetical protein